jgi:predicted hydrocarbon binding protein
MNMAEVISKEEFNQLMKLEGKVRGMSVKSYGDYILKEKGKEGLKKLEEAITRAGYPMKYKDIKTMSFYPLGLEALTLLGIKRIFNFGKEELQEMGKFQAKFSVLIRLFMEHFISIERAARAVPDMWRSYYNIGDLKVVELDQEKGIMILRLENFRLLPEHCHDLTGYFPTISQLIVKKPVTCEETKCSFRGDDYHEFLMKW